MMAPKTMKGAKTLMVPAVRGGLAWRCKVMLAVRMASTASGRRRWFQGHMPQAQRRAGARRGNRAVHLGKMFTYETGNRTGRGLDRGPSRLAAATEGSTGVSCAR